MLCPMKKNVTTYKDYENSQYRKYDESIVTFGECDKENCAWWSYLKDVNNGWCAIQAVNALTTIE